MDVNWKTYQTKHIIATTFQLLRSGASQVLAGCCTLGSLPTFSVVDERRLALLTVANIALQILH